MDYDLVFEGGGAKGMVFVGAMQEFESRGHAYKRLLGTSAGAITAALLAAGYTSKEMLEAMVERVEGKPVFTRFMAAPGPFERAQVLQGATMGYLQSLHSTAVEKFLASTILPWFAQRLACPYSFLEYGGWYSADHFVEWLQKRLDSGSSQGSPRHYSGMSLAQFYNETFIDLSVVASDTTAGAMLVLNHRTAPDVPLVWAVRMSMSIPLVWQEVIWKKEWGLYQKRDLTRHAIVDGGMLSNFPIELFLSKDQVVQNLMGTDTGSQVLGLLIDESCEVAGFPVRTLQAAGIDPLQTPVFQRFQNLLNTMTSAHDKMVIDTYENLVVRLPAKGYGTTEFDMNDEKRDLLVKAGRQSMCEYFDRPGLEAEGAVSFGLGTEEGAPATAAGERTDKIARKILDL